VYQVPGQRSGKARTEVGLAFLASTSSRRQKRISSGLDFGSRPEEENAGQSLVRVLIGSLIATRVRREPAFKRAVSGTARYARRPVARVKRGHLPGWATRPGADHPANEGRRPRRTDALDHRTNAIVERKPARTHDIRCGAALTGSLRRKECSWPSGRRFQGDRLGTSMAHLHDVSGGTPLATPSRNKAAARAKRSTAPPMRGGAACASSTTTWTHR